MPLTTKRFLQPQKLSIFEIVAKQQNDFETKAQHLSWRNELYDTCVPKSIIQGGFLCNEGKITSHVKNSSTAWGEHVNFVGSLLCFLRIK